MPVRKVRPEVDNGLPHEGGPVPPLLLLTFVLVAVLAMLAACSGSPAHFATREPRQVRLSVDGTTYNLTTAASNVRELLQEAGITTAAADQVSPPPFTPLHDDMSVTVVRVREEIESVEESIPFERRIVRSETMSADEPPRIIQGGHNGRQEITTRVVYHDGVEVERQRTQVTLLEEPQDEIVMMGVGTTPEALNFTGAIAYISGGNSLIFRGSTLFPEPLNTGGNLDGRVFSLSPTGSYLLYSRVTSDTGRLNNSLWLVGTERGASPHPLGIDNVLWAEWNPSLTESLEIAYSTGKPVSQPPGWEANNDLWIAPVYPDEELLSNPRQVVEAYPATYGWWGGNYAWSPDGRYIAFSYADEVGLIDLELRRRDEQRTQLRSFPEYETHADWVWLPTLSWSPDSQFLAFSTHEEKDGETATFDIWVSHVASQVTSRFREQAGMWTHPHWSPWQERPEEVYAGSEIAFLQATNPLDSLRSSYTLWFMEQDGSNARQVYPALGENSRFPREQQYMAWGPHGQNIVFIFDDALYVLDLNEGAAQRITHDDTVTSRPTWAPYGAAITAESELNAPPPPTRANPNLEDDLPSEE